MVTIIGVACGIPIAILLACLHCICATKREAVFPVAELEKFNKQ